MSYVSLPNAGIAPTFYEQLPPALPGWQDAPVPGWGMNPYRAGPSRVGVGALLNSNDPVLPRYVQIGSVPQEAYGYIAAAGAGGIVVGLAMAWLWFRRNN